MTESIPISVVIADPDPSLRRVLRKLVAGKDHISVVAEAATGAEALEAVERLKPDVLLLADDIAGPNSLQVVRRISQWLQGTQVIVLAGYPQGPRGKSLAAGAKDYVLKESGGQGIVGAIQRAMLDRSPAEPEERQ